MARAGHALPTKCFCPYREAQLVDGLLAGSMRDSLVLWLTINIALGIVVASTNPELSLRTVAMYLLISASTMFATMAISLRVSVWPSRAKRLVILFPCWFALLLPLVVWGECAKNWETRPSLCSQLYFLVSGPGCYTPHERLG